jgi:PAS domain S-box-containing protein
MEARSLERKYQPIIEYAAMLSRRQASVEADMTTQTRPFRSRARLSQASDSLAGSIADYLGDMVSVHSPDGPYRYVSAASIELLGYAPGELLGTSLFDHLHPDDAGKVALELRGAGEGVPFTLAYRLRRKDGEYVWVEATTRVIGDEESGVPLELVCSTRQLQDRRSLERLATEQHRQSLDRVQEILAGERIRPVFQPIFDLVTEEPIAYEALSRFPGDPARGPDRWFADAWDVGLGVPLELLAVRVAARAIPELPNGVKLCINASPPAILSDGFLPSLGNHADRVKVELTEHLHVDDYEGFGTKLMPLREAGVELAIDDFGAGYASFRHILKVRPDWIKLDISLTERVAENPIAHALAESLISFSDQIGVGVIAEGIETEDELDALLEIGFRYGQGFHFGTPAPLDKVLAGFS